MTRVEQRSGLAGLLAALTLAFAVPAFGQAQRGSQWAVKDARQKDDSTRMMHVDGPVGRAQSVAANFSELSFKVKAGDQVYVVDRSGRELRGEVLDLSPSSMVLSVGGVRRVFTEDDVVRVRQRVPDPLWNGAFIGAAVGAGFGATASAFSEVDSSRRVLGVVAAAGTYALIGAGIDALIQGRKTIFSAPEGRLATLVVVPLLAPGVRGCSIGLRF